MDENKILAEDQMERAAKEFKEDKYKFEAFISYRHLEPDATIAAEIHKMIETFRVPKEFYVDGKRPVYRVFRDREELTAKDLSDSIEDALKNSKYLIVICSRRTPLSEWCVKEIETFRELHGDNRIIPVLIEGEPYESFPQPLKELRRDSGDEDDVQDVLAVELRPTEVQKLDFVGYEELSVTDPVKAREFKKQSLKLLNTEKYRLMATILGCSYGDLKQRDKERRNRLIMSVSSIVAAALLVFGIFMTNAYQRAEKARREAVQSNASILLKNSRDMLTDGDTIKAILVAEEAMKPIDASMENYEELKAEVQGIYNDSIYHSGAAMLTTIPTKNKLTYFSISPDGTKLAAGHGDNKTAIYNPENGELLKVLDGHREQVKIVDYSTDGKFLSSSSFDEDTVIYDSQSGEEVARLNQAGIPMMAVFSKDATKFFKAGLGNKGIEFKVYNTADWTEERGQLFTENVKYAEISQDGQNVLLISSDADLTELSIRDLNTGEIIKKYETPKFEDEVLSSIGSGNRFYNWAKYSNDGTSILAEASGNLLKINADSGEFIINESLSIDTTTTPPIESKSGSTIIAKSGNKIIIIDGMTGAQQDEIYFGNMDVVSFAYDEDSNTIVVSGDNGLIGIWKNGAIIESGLSFGRGVPTELKFTPDGSKVIASAHDNQVIKIIDIDAKLIEEPIEKQLVAVSNNSEHVLFYDDEGLWLWNGKGSEHQKISIVDSDYSSYITEVRDFKISNDGRYLSRIVTILQNDTASKVVLIEDIVDKTSIELPLVTGSQGVTFTSDSSGIVIVDELNGMRIYDAKSGDEILSHPHILSNSYKLLASPDGHTIVVNRLSGVADMYELESGELITKIPGEILYVNGQGESIKARGVYNNSGFKWENGELQTFELDENTSETPIDFGDVNLYNEESQRLLMIRNNETERISYLVDFTNGKLMMRLKSQLKTYRINGYISPDGNVIAMDQSFYVNYNAEGDNQPKIYRSTAIYEILAEEEMLSEVEKVRGGRVLTEDEKVQIGIK